MMKKIFLILGLIIAHASIFACSYTLVMDDSFGDGWDGAYIDVYINGGLVGTYTVGAGFSSSTITLTVNQGDNVQLYYTAGSWESEHTWTLYNASSTAIAGGGPTPATGLVYSGTGDCGSTGPATAGDCSVALTVCTNLGFQVDAAGSGSINEIPTSGSYGNPLNNNPGGSGNWGCLQIGESNSTWMVINVGSSGNLEFNFGGAAQAGFYDWIMYPYNANSCSDIPNNLVAPVRCNWNYTNSGGTGLSDNPLAIGGDPGNFEPSLPVSCGDQYIICFSNYSSALTNVPLSFGGTASIACELTCAGNSPCQVTPGDPTYSDCINAIPVCQNYYCQEFSFATEGAITGEINSSLSCLGSGEKNDVWYTISVQQSGDLNFTITPSNTGDDYDWAVFDLSSAPCSDIASNGALEVGCDYSGSVSNNAETGPNGGSEPQDEPVIPVVAGETYVINVSNYSSTQSGYALDFSASTAVIFDNIAPVISNLVGTQNCGGTTLTFQFSENVLCNTVQNCDFTLTGPGGPYTLSGVTGDACALGGMQEDVFAITVSPAMTASGAYSLNLVPGCGFVEDLCGNVAIAGSLPFNITAIDLTITGSTTSCASTCDGTVMVTINSGSANFDYDWSGTAATNYTNSTNNTSNLTNTLISLCPDDYTVTVTDNSGCTMTASTTVAPGPSMTINLTPNDASCGSTDGSINATITGGSPNFTYAINPTPGSGAGGQGSSYTYSGLGANTYFVTVTDANGCTIEASAVISAGGTVIAGFTYDGNQCYNPAGNTVSFTNTSVGATSYAWDFTGDGVPDNTSFEPTWNFTAPGIYSVDLEASLGGCVDDYNLLVTIYDLPILGFIVTQPSCSLACDGVIQADPAVGGPAGSGVFTDYIWSPGGATTQTISNLCDNTYYVTVTDNVGCTVTGNATITDPAPMVATPTTTHLVCNGVCAGAANVLPVTGGSGSYNYQWNTGATSSSISSLCANIYTVTITDAASSACQLVETFDVQDAAPMVLTTGSTNSTCNNPDGIATVSVTGASGSISYVWSPAGGTGGNTATYSNITAGLYTVDVTDGNGCTAQTTVNVSDDAGPVVTITNSTTLNCYADCDGDITATIVGGQSPYTYNWDNNTTVYQSSNLTETEGNLCVGIHTIEITDANGCATTDNITFTEPPELTVTLVPTNANCSTPGSAAIFINGGVSSFSQNWGGENPASLTTGFYTVTVTDANNCTATGSVTIGDDGSVGVSIISSTPVSCYGFSDGTATAEITGGTANYTYTWDQNGQTVVSSSLTTDQITGLSAGTVYVTVTDNNSCSGLASIDITEPSQLTASISGTTAASCMDTCDGTATVTQSGGTASYTYSWDFGAGNQTTATATGLCNGSYTVTVIDANTCTATATATITEPSVLQVSATATTAHCGQNDGTASITSVTGGNPGAYTPLWPSGSPTNLDDVYLLYPGTYVVTVTDPLGCIATTSVTVGDDPAGGASIVNVVNVSCNGDANGQASVSCTGTSPFTYLWSNGQTSQTATGLSGGEVSVIATDDVGCIAYDTVLITEPDLLLITLVPSEPNCYGENGSLLVNTTGGTPAYSYAWSIGPGGPSISVPIGLYCVTVTDANFCTAFGCETVTQPPPISVSDSIIDATCNLSNGAIYLDAAGGQGTLEFEWNPGISIVDSLVNIAAGNYSVTISDAKDCTYDTTYVVANLSGPSLVLDSVNDVSCYGGNNGIITVTASGGTLPYTYEWNDLFSQTTAMATVLIAGDYEVTVMDADSCVASMQVTVIEPPELDMYFDQYNPLCNGTDDGWAEVTPYGGVSPYTYTWTGNGTVNGNVFEDLAGGQYDVMVEDFNGCTALHVFTLTQPTELIMTLGKINASCPNSGDGKAFIDTLYGGVPPYTYLWSNWQLTDTAFNLDPGQYCVTATDANGCTQFACIDVITPSSLQIDSVVSEDVSCFEESSGSISIYISGGTPSYAYYWTESNDSVGGAPSISNIPQGYYTALVTDANGCTVTSNTIINQPGELTMSITSNSLLCYGDTDGILSSDVAGGQPPYTYFWSNFDSGDFADSLWVGDHYLTVTDANDCQIFGSGNIFEPALLDVTDVIITDAECDSANGCAQLVFNGGTVGYIYDWGFPDGNSIYECGLAANTYVVTVSDANDCTTMEWVIVNNSSGPTINFVSVTDVTCNGYSDGTAIVNYNESNPPAGPYTINWYDDQSILITSAPDVSSLSGGTHSVQVIDANNCEASMAFIVNEPAQLASAIGNYQNPDCYGTCNGWAQVSVLYGTPPYSYAWSTGGSGAQESSLCSGTSSVVITDANQCTITSAVTLYDPPQLIMSADIDDVTCYGSANGVIDINPWGGSGSFDYYYPSVSPPPGNVDVVSSLPPGDYIVIVSDQQNQLCTIDSVFTIVQPNPIAITYTTTPATCNAANGTVTLDPATGASGAFNYVWSPPNTYPTATGFAHGTNYALQVIDQVDDQCILTELIAVDRVPPPVIFYTETHNPTCHDYGNGSAMVRVKDGTGPYYYEWYHVTNNAYVSAGEGDSLVTTLLPGLYNVTITDGDTCQVSTSLIINNPDPVTVYGYGSTTICNGGFAVISASANGGTFPYSYVWGDATITDSAQVQIVYPESSTSYMVSATDFNGCFSTPDLITVVVLPPIEVTIHAAGIEICQGDSVNLTAAATGGASPYSFFWNNGSMTASNYASPLVSDTLMVIAYDADFCSAPDTAYQPIIVYPKPYLSMKANLYAGCEPLTVSFYNDTNQTSIYYDWNFGDYNSSYNTSNSQTPSHTFEMSGSFDVTLTLTDLINTCVNQFTFSDMINVYQRPDAAFTMFPGETSLFNAEIQFTDMSTGPVTDWLWSFGDATNSTNPYPLHIYEYADTFTVNMIVSNIITADIVCDDQVSNTIVINPEYTFYAPTAFAPINATSSRENSFWTPKGNGISLEPGTYMLNIYNRWGELIFSADQFYDPGDPNASSEKNRWNGRWNGKGNEFNVGEVVPVGVYTWYVRLIDVTGMEHEESGSVTVIR